MIWKPGFPNSVVLETRVSKVYDSENPGFQPFQYSNDMETRVSKLYGDGIPGFQSFQYSKDLETRALMVFKNSRLHARRKRHKYIRDEGREFTIKNVLKN